MKRVVVTGMAGITSLGETADQIFSIDSFCRNHIKTDRQNRVIAEPQIFNHCCEQNQPFRLENIVKLAVNRMFAQGLRCRQSEIKTFAAAERSGVSLSAGTARC